MSEAKSYPTLVVPVHTNRDVKTMSDDPKCPRKPPKLRRRYVLQNIAQKSISQIAIDCGVDEKTIDRDIKKLKESGEWDQWIEAEFLRLSRSTNVSDTAKFKEYRQLYGKTLVQKTEIETKGDVNITFKMWRPNIDDDDSDKLLPP